MLLLNFKYLRTKLEKTSKAPDPSHLHRGPEAPLGALPALQARGFIFRGKQWLQGPGVGEALYLVPTIRKGPVPQGNEAFAEHTTSYIAKKTQSTVLAPASDFVKCHSVWCERENQLT